MSIADELDANYELYEARMQAQSSALRRLAGVFQTGYAKYVGATPNVWNKPDGKVGGTRVRLGVGEPQSFEEMAWPKLPTFTDGSVPFSICHTLVSGNTGSVYHIVFLLTARCTPDGYQLSLEHHDGTFFFTADQASASDFIGVYAAMVEAIKRNSNPASVIIPQVSH